ncbi:hypothetical protein KUV56_08550 [Ferrimonas balearica]|uniref:competence protein CoiA family protein n=1 Tax=Ferrimonas balearica TaxID=44012 RepID=UPI001C56CB1C|nr:competence protein CoiA family protein [Ferrimonas balearica]MBW3139563.1 hypothetical protein [Ferrimonas balearica]
MENVINYMPNTLSLQEVELQYGLKDGVLVHIGEVDSGLACNCHCPHCQSALIARKGDIRAHHFAHHSSTDCGAGPETALHMMAKEVIDSKRQLMLPAQSLTLKDDRLPNLTLVRFTAPQVTELSSVEIESATSDYRPDLSVVTQEGEPLDIEIKVTHEVDDLKVSKVQSLRRTMIEIDLSSLPRDSSKADIEHAVMWSAPRHYVHSDWQQSADAQLKAQVESCCEAIRGRSHKPKLMTTSKEHVMLLGHKIGSGYSRKYQSNFEISHLFYVLPAQKNDTANFSIKASAGFEPDKVEVDTALIEKLRQLDYPCPALLHRSIKPGMGRQTKWIVTDIEPVLP